MVATTTTASGLSPLYLHLMSINFSAPISAPNPLSVTTYSPSFIAIWSARIELLPWAIFAKGPACTKHGVCSIVCKRFGFIASFRSTVIAPATWRSSAVTGFPSYVEPITILPSLCLRSFRLVVNARMAITSEATVISYPVSLGLPFISPPRPIIMFLKALSLTSTTLLSVIENGSILRSLPFIRCVSRKAHRRL